MLNSDILRRLRYALAINDTSMVELFKLGGVEIELNGIRDYLKKEEDEGYTPLNDKKMIAFLDGLIISKRGISENSKVPVAEELSNNLILRKLKIAFEFKDTDCLAILKKEGLELSKSELSAFFRGREQKNYKECKDQVLRKFLAGLVGYKREV